MKTKEDHIKAQLNVDRLTPLQYDGILRAMHQFAAQAVEQRDREIEPLILAMNEYITLLGKELDDCYSFLTVHGWQSKRVQEGINARNKILEIKKRFSSTEPTPQPSIMDEVKRLRDETAKQQIEHKVLADKLINSTDKNWHENLSFVYSNLVDELNQIINTKQS